MIKLKIGNKRHSLSVVYRKYVRGLVSSFIANIIFLKLRRPSKKNRIILVGHRFNGNLKAFYDYIINNHNDFEVLFYTDDPIYYKSFGTNSAHKIYSLQKLKHLKQIAAAKAICTSHGPLSLSLWKNSKNRPLFIELWHGAGFKNRTIEETKPRLFYDAVFVSSPTFKNFHKDWGYDDSQLAITGYAQVDSLQHQPNRSQRKAIKQQFGINEDFKGKIILYAPTWDKNNPNKLSPFGTSPTDFFTHIGKVMELHSSLLLVLPHINSDISSIKKRGIRIISASGEIDIKPLLKVVDILVTDWSSIYTDFLALPEKKPVVFIDNPPSFYGYTLTPEDRAGPIVSNVKDLEEVIVKAVKNPDGHMEKYSSMVESTTHKVWGDTLDGKSAERYMTEIKRLLDEQ